MVDLATLRTAVDSSPVKKATEAFQQFQTATTRTANSVGKFEQRMKKFADQQRASIKITQQLRSVLLTLSAAFGVREIVRASDTWKNLEGRLKLVTRSTAELAAVQERLFQISQRTRSGYESTVTLFQRVARVQDQLGKSTEQVLQFTELSQKAIRASGATAQEASAGVIQLSQALASGVLRGDEYRSVMENLSGFALELSKGLGVTLGELRKMANEGKLTADKVFEGIQKRQEQIDAAFAKLPITVDQAFTKVQNAFLRFIGTSGDANIVMGTLIDLLNTVANNLNIVAEFALAAAAAWGINYVRGAVAAAAANEGLLLSFNLLARRLAVFAAIYGAFEVLNANGIKSITQALDNLKVVGLGLLNEIQKIWNMFSGVLGGIYNAVVTTFRDIGKIFDGFKQDLVTFLIAPLNFQGFQNLESAIGDGMGTAIKQAYEKVIGEAKAQNADLDAELEALLLEVGNKYRNASKNGGPLDLSGGEGAGAIDPKLQEMIKKRQEFTKELKIELEQLKRIAAANDNSVESYDSVSDAIERENMLRELGLNLTSKQGQALDKELEQRQRLVKRIQQTTEVREKAIRKAEQEREQIEEALRKPFENALTNVQNSFTNFFEDVFTNGIDSFASLADGIKKIFIRLAAEMATLQFFGPQGVPGILSGGASGGAGGVGSLLSGASSLGNLFGGAGALSGAINSFGASVGFGAGSSGLSLASSTALTPFSPGAAGTLTSTPLASILGPAALGFMGGGVLADMLGLNSTGGSIGGGLGAGIAAGAGFGPPGMILGALLGTVGGGLLGGKAHPQASFSGNVDQQGGIGGLSFLSKHMGTEGAEALAGQVSNITKTLFSAGIDITGKAIHGAVNDKGGFFRLGDQQFNFDPSSESDVDRALKELIVAMTQVADVTNMDVIKALENLQTEGKTAAEVLQEIQIAASMKALRDALNTQVSDAILAITNPQQSAVNQLNKEFDNLRKQGIETGADLVKIEELYNLRRQELLESFAQEDIKFHESRLKQFDDLRAKLRSFSESLLLGGLSPLSPDKRLTEANRQFEDIAARAKLGDTDAIAKLPEVSQQLLEESKSYYASSEAYFRDFDRVQQVLKDTEAVAGRHADIAQEQLTQLQEQTNLLAQFTELFQSQDNGKNPELNRVLRAATGYQGAFGQGGFGNFITSNAVDDTVRELARTIIKQFGQTPGFASGGFTPVNDNFIVGERGPEVLSFNKGAKVSPIQDGSRLAGVFESYKRQSAQETLLLRETIEGLRTELEGLRRDVRNSKKVA